MLDLDVRPSKACEACGIRKTSICGVLSNQQLIDLYGKSATRYFKSGEILILNDVSGRDAFTVKSGDLILFKLLADGRRQVLGFLFRGDFMGIDKRAEAGIGIQALTDGEICHFQPSYFYKFVHDVPDLEEEIHRLTLEDLNSARSHLTLLGRKTAVERVASFIQYMVARGVQSGGDADTAFLHMSRGDIADYLGLTTETVSRIFSMLKRDGSIQLFELGGVRLLKPEKIEAMAGY
jgi:CRP/FNR family transcriptional regulator